MSEFLSPKFVIALVVLGLFGWALAVDPDDATMKGALIAGFAGAWGFYLGSSNSSSMKSDQVGQALNLAAANAPPTTSTTTTTTTATSEQAEADQTEEPQKVEVVNQDENPVPTKTPPKKGGKSG